MEKIIAQGAEARIILSNNFIIKTRLKKGYRLPELDEKIRKQRTKSESKLLEKASQIINSPKPFFQPCIDGASRIKMPFINGKKLSENLDSFSFEKQKNICREIGKNIAKLHDADIIHGDLTTSNMILVEDFDYVKKAINNKISLLKPTSKKVSSLTINNKSVSEANLSSEGVYGNNPKIKGKFDKENLGCLYFIDFGLGYISKKAEDKAVDLHLLKQALEAKHFQYWETLWQEIERGYKLSKESKKVLKRLKAVEKRGRYKNNY
ncbi:MAG: hypothetical protein AABW50_03855 [Nanoarchaeota archaeon]